LRAGREIGRFYEIDVQAGETKKEQNYKREKRQSYLVNQGGGCCDKLLKERAKKNEEKIASRHR